MKNIRVWINPFNYIVIETWDRSYELEVQLTVEEARELASQIRDLAAEAGANIALARPDVV